jgi:hypothetical protein
MKFLCVSCDEAMKLTEARPPDRGSLTVVYRCPTCAHEIAMLTNPYETQVVGSLGVKIGADAAESEGGSKCPFSGVVQEMGLGPEDARREFPWSAEAASRLANIPEFARPMAKSGIEKYAKDHGLAQVDIDVLDEAREFFGM